jgi:hypothetical protein
MNEAAFWLLMAGAFAIGWTVAGQHKARVLRRKSKLMVK